MTFDPTFVEVTCVTLPKDHCVQVPWEYINVCGYSDKFCKIYHIHTHTTYRISDHISLFLKYVQARQKVQTWHVWNHFKGEKKKKKIKINFQLTCYFPTHFVVPCKDERGNLGFKWMSPGRSGLGKISSRWCLQVYHQKIPAQRETTPLLTWPVFWIPDRNVPELSKIWPPDPNIFCVAQSGPGIPDSPGCTAHL